MDNYFIFVFPIIVLIYSIYSYMRSIKILKTIEELEKEIKILNKENDEITKRMLSAQAELASQKAVYQIQKEINKDLEIKLSKMNDLIKKVQQ